MVTVISVCSDLILSPFFHEPSLNYINSVMLTVFTLNYPETQISLNFALIDSLILEDMMLRNWIFYNNMKILMEDLNWDSKIFL